MKGWYPPIDVTPGPAVPTGGTAAMLTAGAPAAAAPAPCCCCAWSAVAPAAAVDSIVGVPGVDGAVDPAEVPS